MASMDRIVVGVLASLIASVAPPVLAQRGDLSVPFGTPAGRGAAAARAEAVRIDGLDVEEVARLAPGTPLVFSLFGTPDGVATLQIDGARRSLALREVERGVYEGTYTVDPQDRIAADGRVVATLRRGTDVATSVLDEPLVLDTAAPNNAARRDLARSDEPRAAVRPEGRPVPPAADRAAPADAPWTPPALSRPHQAETPRTVAALEPRSVPPGGIRPMTPLGARPAASDDLRATARGESRATLPNDATTAPFAGGARPVPVIVAAATPYQGGSPIPGASPITGTSSYPGARVVTPVESRAVPVAEASAAAPVGAAALPPVEERRIAALDERRVAAPPTTLAAAPAVVPAAPPPAPSSTDACADCAVVESVREVDAGSGRDGVAGAVGGGILGALLGSTIGHGDARGIAGLIGAIGGALAGREVERAGTRKVRYDVVLRMPDGGSQVHSFDSPPALKVGERIRVPSARYARAPRVGAPD